MDEVFRRENFVSLVSFQTKIPLRTTLIANVHDYLLWYARGTDRMKFRKLYISKGIGDEGRFNLLQLPDGTRSYMSREEKGGGDYIPTGSKPFVAGNLNSAGRTESCVFDFEYQGRVFRPTRGKSWKTSLEGLKSLATVVRLLRSDNNLYYVLFHEDYPVQEIANVWSDTRGEMDKLYAVQTATTVIERCLLMTTDPGDLVFDPTCGSGTTAYCAEKWGRRWITCDTSRVALAIARQRLMTAKFDYYELKEPARGPAGGFNYETVPQITLESIAKNTEIDAIAARYQPEIDQAQADLNRALGREWKEWEVTREVPNPMWPEEARQAYRHLLELKRSGKLGAEKEAEPLLETVYRLTGHRWTVNDIPEPMPPADWPAEARAALARFWELKRRKRQEIDDSIHRNAPQETLYDKPQVKRGVVRVTGPFTVEAIPVPAVEDPTQAPVPQFEAEEAQARVSDRGGDYLTTMINLLKQQGGVLFPGGKKLELTNLLLLNVGLLHAEAEAKQNGKAVRVAVSFGPPHGPVIAHQVQEALPTAKMNGYQVLLFAGFAFDPEAQALIQKAPVAGLQVHFANIAPDVLVGDLLKTTRASQIFTVFGQPDVRVEKQKDGTYRVELRGVDIYDPLTGEVHSTRGEDVAAWFLDTDYDGMTFHICQAFFPGEPDAWEKLQRALKAQIDPEAFDRMRGTVSFPLQPGEHHRIAVKVIDFRGNEVIRVLPLERATYAR
jgi:adenine-specific DNA-methyltransferase